MIEEAIRPRFRIKSSLSKEEIVGRIHKKLEQQKGKVVGIQIDTHIILKIPIAQQHYWSPQLDVEIETIDNQSIIKGLFGPRPSVWFMYVFFYSVLGFIGVMVMIMGFSQLNLGLSARILWLLPLLTILFLIAFSTAKAGQKLGANEMLFLYQFLLKSIG